MFLSSCRYFIAPNVCTTWKSICLRGILCCRTFTGEDKRSFILLHLGKHRVKVSPLLCLTHLYVLLWEAPSPTPQCERQCALYAALLWRSGGKLSRVWAVLSLALWAKTYSSANWQLHRSPGNGGAWSARYLCMSCFPNPIHHLPKARQQSQRQRIE